MPLPGVFFPAAAHLCKNAGSSLSAGPGPWQHRSLQGRAPAPAEARDNGQSECGGSGCPPTPSARAAGHPARARS